MSIGIAHHREVTDHTTDVHGRLDENVSFASKLRDSVDFLARFALKSEVIETGLHFILHND
jgi:hypothetical protein